MLWTARDRGREGKKGPPAKNARELHDVFKNSFGMPPLCQSGKVDRKSANRCWNPAFRRQLAFFASRGDTGYGLNNEYFPFKGEFRYDRFRLAVS